MLRIEVVRAVGRVMPAALPDARALLEAFDYVSIDDEVVDAAMNEPDRMLPFTGRCPPCDRARARAGC